jgi:hypothetical protein
MSSGMAILLLVAIILAGVAAMTIIALYVTYGLWLPYLLSQLADRDLFVTRVEEGTGKWIVKNRQAWRFITSKLSTDPNPVFDDDDSWNLEKVLKDKTNRKLTNAEGEEPGWVHWLDSRLPGGMRWVGWPFIYKIYSYNFRWEYLREAEPLSTENSLIGKRKLANGKWVASFAKRINYIYLRDSVYYFELIGTETKGSTDPNDTSVGIACDIYANATMRVINPYRTVFLVHDWLSSMLELIRPSLRSWIARLTFPEVVRKYEAAEREHDIFLRQPSMPSDAAATGTGIEPPKPIGEYIEVTYGVRVKRIAFDDVIPPESFAVSVTLRTEAEQNKIRTITNAQAEAQRQEIVAQGEAARIKIVTKALKAGGDVALALRTLEAYEALGAQGNTIVLGGGNPVQMLLDSARNKKKEESEKQ